MNLLAPRTARFCVVDAVLTHTVYRFSEASHGYRKGQILGEGLYFEFTQSNPCFNPFINLMFKPAGGSESKLDTTDLKLQQIFKVRKNRNWYFAKLYKKEMEVYKEQTKPKIRNLDMEVELAKGQINSVMESNEEDSKKPGPLSQEKEKAVDLDGFYAPKGPQVPQVKSAVDTKYEFDEVPATR